MKRTLLLLALLAATVLSGCARRAGTYPILTDGTTLQPGDYLRYRSVGGAERSYILHVPANYPLRHRIPVVFVFHGGGGTAEGAVSMTNFNPLADQSYFLVVYPNGTGRLGDKFLTWNGGTCCGYAQTQNIDDVAFVRLIVQDLRQLSSIDENRIYATGISNGGIMSYRLACEAADIFAAVAPVSGTLNYAACSPSQPVSVLHIHGTADQHLPYNGGNGDRSLTTTDFVSVADTIAFWVQADGCDPASATTQSGSIIHEVYSSCAPGTNVELYTIVDGLHAWPGSTGPGWPGGDHPTQELNATSVMWDFFAAHPKP